MSQLRTPICCLQGHVDVGKTHISDALRKSSVHAKEFGGITQQIGATFYSKEYLQKQTKTLNSDINVPGLLMIDTPGHECFSNLREKGMEISDISIVVVDFVKGVEHQTFEIINNLKKYRTPYIIVANKVDTVYQWKNPNEGMNFIENYKRQTDKVKSEYDTCMKNIILKFNENGVNVAPFYKNPDSRSYASIVPISAKTCEGIAEMIMLIIKLAEKFMKKKLAVNEDEHGGYIVEKYKDNQHGTLINAILTDGNLSVGDEVRVCGQSLLHSIKVKEIYVPNEAIEMKGKTKYTSVKSVDASKGIMLKLENPDLVETGTMFKILKENTNIKEIDKILQNNLNCHIKNIIQKDFNQEGVLICCPYYGPIEAVWKMCKDKSIPVSGIVVGELKKADIFKLASRTKSDKKNDPDGYFYEKQLRIVLAYQCDVNKETIENANINDVTIIQDQVIYQLMEKYEIFKENINSKLKEKYPNIVPQFKARIIPKYVFKTKDPIIVGVKIHSGILHKCVIKSNSTSTIIGTIVSIEKDHKIKEFAKENDEVCLKIDVFDGKRVEYGKEFNHLDEIVPYFNAHESNLLKRFGEIFN